MDVGIKCIICCILMNFAVPSAHSESEAHIISVKSVKLSEGYEQFPEYIDVQFGYQGNEVLLYLRRDEAGTSMLNEGVFEVSKFLPSGIFTEEKRKNFVAYEGVKSNDFLVVHRELENAEPKFYGRFTQDSEKMIIQPDDTNLEFHRVKREDSPKLRNRRSTEAAIIEMFVFADFSLFDNVKSLRQSSSLNDNKLFTRDIVTGMSKEVDAIYQYIDEYSGVDNFNLRVYLQQYQIITKESQQPWMSFSDDLNTIVDASSLAALNTYYQDLQEKYAFPQPDILVQLTSYNLPWDFKEIHNGGTICGTGNSLPVAIVSSRRYGVSVSKTIARSFGLTSPTSCSSGDLYIMSVLDAMPTAAEQGNQWKFSSCSIGELTYAVNTIDLSCLTIQDSVFDLEAYESSPTMNDLLSLTETCQVLIDPDTSYTSASDVDCYSTSTSCQGDGGPYYPTIPTGTPCNLGPDARCVFGFCETGTSANSSSSSSSSSSTSSSTSTTTSTTSTTATTSTSTATTSSTTATTSTATSTTATTSTSTATTSTGSTSTSTETTSSTPSPTTTTDDDLQTSTTTALTSPTTKEPEDCVITTGYVEFDLPGCGCCGGCGCDKGCPDCEPGLPSKTKADSCTKEENCCASKVSFKTLLVPPGCELTYKNGPRTFVMEKKGWKDEDANLNAEVYQDMQGRWQIQLKPRM